MRPQPSPNETPEQRAARIEQLRLLVRAGEYDTSAEQLADAMLEWTGQRQMTYQTEREYQQRAGNRRRRMRLYMQRRRERLRQARGVSPVLACWHLAPRRLANRWRPAALDSAALRCYNCCMGSHSTAAGPLAQALASIQCANRWSDARMAAEIGVSRQMWRFFRAGERRAGLETLRGIQRRFPALAEAVSWYLEGLVR